MAAAQSFNLPVYLEKSRKLDVTGIDWADVPRHPLSSDEIRILTYTMDIESNTIVYLKELLASRAAEEPDTVAFLSCWNYEEYFHGYYIRRFLESAGVDLGSDRFKEVSTRRSPLYVLQQVGHRLMAGIFRQGFMTIYMAWGAINELATLEAYQVIGGRTRHPVLADLLGRIVKDERRHFAFYFSRARDLLANPSNCKIASTVVSCLWQLVGSGERPQSEVDFVLLQMLAGPDGQRAGDSITRKIRELPGFERWDGIARARAQALRREGRSARPLEAVFDAERVVAHDRGLQAVDRDAERVVVGVR